MPLRCRLGQTNRPDRKNIAAMKKLSLNSHHAVEAEERLLIGMAEIGVGDHRMVDQHQHGDEGAGAIERGVARLGFRRRLRLRRCR